MTFKINGVLNLSNLNFMILILFMLICLSAFFSASETSFSTVNKMRLRNYAENGNKKAQTALEISEKFDQVLSTILVGNNLVNIASSSIATVIAVELFQSSGALISTILMTIVVLIFGEVIPKGIASENSEKFTLFIAKPMKVLMIVSYPIVFMLIKLKNIILKIFGSKTHSPYVTEQELKYIVKHIEKEGVLEEDESTLVRSALEFDDKTAEEILTPRVDMAAINISDPIDKIKKVVLDERYSRMPVYKDSIDNIIGILHTRDFIEAIALNKNLNIFEMISPAYYIYKTKSLSSLLSEFKHKKLHIAIVSDDYGGTLGMVTMEDLLEQIVGDIWDEDEEIEHKFTKISDSIYEVSGDANIHEVFDLIGFYDKNFETESNSFGGWVFEYFGRLPNEGEEFEYKGLKIKVKEVSDQRITKLIVEK